MNREVYVVKNPDGTYLLDNSHINCNPWKKGEIPVEIVRFFPDITTAKKSGSNRCKSIKVGNRWKANYKIIKVNLSMEEIEEVFENDP